MATMIPIAPRLDVLNLLYEQYRLYTTDLGRNHEGLGRLYKKVAKLDSKLERLDGQSSSRTARRKLTWSRSLAKQSIVNLVAYQAELYSLLEQCRDLIVSYNASAYAAPMTPWTTYMPSTPYTTTPFSPVPPTPWSLGPTRLHVTGSAPQYWDLSMLYDQASFPWPDSNIPLAQYQSLTDATPADTRFDQHPHQIYCHELVGSLPTQLDDETANSKLPKSSHLTTDNPRRAASVVINDTGKASELHKRRYSENITKSAQAVQGSTCLQQTVENTLLGLDVVRPQTAPDVVSQGELVEGGEET